MMGMMEVRVKIRWMDRNNGNKNRLKLQPIRLETKEKVAGRTVKSVTRQK